MDAAEERLLQEVGPAWMAAMRQGDFATAWAQTDRLEQRRTAEDRNCPWQRASHHLLWNGQPLAGRRVLVRCEHGLGDSLQFLRYGARLRQMGCNVTAQVQPALLEVCRGLQGLDALHNAWSDAPWPEHDVAVECMELPYALRDTLATLPREVPYLPVWRLQQTTPAWKLALGFKVGLIWAASAWDPRRSLSFDDLQPLLQIPGVSFYSLQQGPEREEVRPPVVQLHEHTAAVEAAARAMLEMDLIITVDGMTAHLAGALARPVWVLLPEQADWRWMEARDDSPWYPTMQLFRRRAGESWARVVSRVEQALRRRCVA